MTYRSVSFTGVDVRSKTILVFVSLVAPNCFAASNCFPFFFLFESSGEVYLPAAISATRIRERRRHRNHLPTTTVDAAARGARGRFPNASGDSFPPWSSLAFVARGLGLVMRYSLAFSKNQTSSPQCAEVSTAWETSLTARSEEARRGTRTYLHAAAARIRIKTYGHDRSLGIFAPSRSNSLTHTLLRH